MSNPTSLSEIRRTLRSEFPAADIKVSKQDDALTVTTDDYLIRAVLEAFVTKTYGLEYIGRRCKDGTMDGDIYGSRWDYRHRFDFVPITNACHRVATEMEDRAQ
jgi:hypothetical protein